MKTVTPTALYAAGSCRGVLPSPMGASTDDINHLLRRAGFAPTAAEIAALSGGTIAAAVEHVLDRSLVPAVVEPPELTDPSKGEWDRSVALYQWWIERMRTTPAPLAEKMVVFWHGHFVSGLDKCTVAQMWQQLELFRTQGMGSFHNLAQAVALNPAMLTYLDNQYNVVGSPNENFARELMELFTLGIGNYAQDDVVASARAWTGYGLTTDGTAFELHPADHDNANKTFLGTTKDWSGPDIIDEICAGSMKPVCARWIARKVWSFFAHPDPEPTVLDDVTAALLASSDLDITALLRAVFNHPAFYSAECKQGLVRTPTEFMVAALRYLGITAVGDSGGHPEWWADDMGQRLLYPPNVAGWGSNAYWIGFSAYQARANYARFLTWGAPSSLLGDTTAKPNPADAVAEALATFGIASPTAHTTGWMTDWLASERSAQGWAERVNLITLSLLTPDFQLA